MMQEPDRGLFSKVRSFNFGRADPLQPLLLDPAAAEAVSLREQILAVDHDLLESWDFDVFFYTREQLIAHVCAMFMRLGLTQHQVWLLHLPADLLMQGDAAACLAASPELHTMFAPGVSMNSCL